MRHPSGFASVRSAAQRKLSGQSLELLFNSFDGLSSAERRQLVPILEKIDVHFAGQLRRALHSTTEQETVRALRIVIDSQRVPDVEESLFDLTVSPSARVRATLARTFESTSREPALHYLRLYLGDPDARVIANSVETLGRIGDRRAASWLEPLRTHATHRVRVMFGRACAPGNNAVAGRCAPDPRAQRNCNERTRVSRVARRRDGAFIERLVRDWRNHRADRVVRTLRRAGPTAKTANLFGSQISHVAGVCDPRSSMTAQRADRVATGG